MNLQTQLPARVLFDMIYNKWHHGIGLAPFWLKIKFTVFGYLGGIFFAPGKIGFIINDDF